MSGDRPPQRVSAAQIADLLARARSITAAGPAADPTQRVAYLIAKAELLARIADQHAENCPCHAAQARQVAADARSSAAQAAALLPDSRKDTT
jgi:hypothetical protein